MIPYGRQDIDQTDVDSVIEVLRSDFLTQGPKVPIFEEAICSRVGATRAVAVNSATSALHIACVSLGLGPGDWLWTSPNTFVASANCGRYCGASIDFVDIDPTTLNMSVDGLKAKLEDAEEKGKLPKVVIPVHFAGEPCDMASIGRLADRYGFKVIEDASHAIGADHLRQPVGSCEFSDITVFSFHPVKIITTAEGGVATTNDSEVADRMTRLRTHGVTRDKGAMTRVGDGDWYYEQVELGFNYRMTDMQAALGISQLDRLDGFIDSRHRLADRYDVELMELPIRLPRRNQFGRASLHLYPIQCSDAVVRKTLFDYLRLNGVGVNVHYIPVHTQPDYRRLGFRKGEFPNAERYYGSAVSLPMHSNLTDRDQDYVIERLRVFFEKSV